MNKNICVICGGEIFARLVAHNLCVARQKLGLKTPPLGNAPEPECKVFQGQLFEKKNGQWRRVI